MHIPDEPTEENLKPVLLALPAMPIPYTLCKAGQPTPAGRIFSLEILEDICRQPPADVVKVMTGGEEPYTIGVAYGFCVECLELKAYMQVVGEFKSVLQTTADLNIAMSGVGRLGAVSDGVARVLEYTLKEIILLDVQPRFVHEPSSDDILRCHAHENSAVPLAGRGPQGTRPLPLH